jgi:hypothetical protein
MRQIIEDSETIEEKDRDKDEQKPKNRCQASDGQHRGYTDQYACQDMNSNPDTRVVNGLIIGAGKYQEDIWPLAHQ